MDIKLFDKVYIIRSNDVIPKINESKHTPLSKDIELFKCPSCGTKLIMKGVDYFCPNYMNCKAQKINKFIHWFTMCKIENLGPSSIEKLIELGNISQLWELYSMTEKELVIFIERFVGLDRNTDKMKRFLVTFNNSHNLTEQEVIGYYGIPSIGLKTLKVLEINNLNDLIKYGCVNYLSSDVAAEAKLCAWLNEEGNYDNLFSLVKFLKPSSKKSTNIALKKFCITGAFDRKRNTIIREIEELGFEFSSTVTRDLEFLIVGDENGISNKILAANKFGIPIIPLGKIWNIQELKKHINIF
jgi:DNA ligase (NAD+)